MLYFPAGQGPLYNCCNITPTLGARGQATLPIRPAQAARLRAPPREKLKNSAIILAISF